MRHCNVTKNTKAIPIDFRKAIKVMLRGKAIPERQ